MPVLHHYDDNHLPKSAKEILPLLFSYIQPTSVIDIGCGIGQWLLAFQLFGVSDYLGIDGDHVEHHQLMIPTERFRPMNLCNPDYSLLNKKWDIVLNLEVAEHLPEEHADRLIDYLVAAGNNILFSAAVPDQTGENHLNEQWPSYWSEKFENRGYVMLDIFRKKIWNNPSINWWYRQNIFLVTCDQNLIANFKLEKFNGMNVVHPELLKMHIGLNKPVHRKKKNFFKLFRK
jgi:hypothetical protein